MLDAIKTWLNPLAIIANELRIIRELYELDLASRDTPIYRITETPKESDTKVTYMGEVDDTPAYKRWLTEDEE